MGMGQKLVLEMIAGNDSDSDGCNEDSEFEQEKVKYISAPKSAPGSAPEDPARNSTRNGIAPMGH